MTLPPFRREPPRRRAPARSVGVALSALSTLWHLSVFAAPPPLPLPAPPPPPPETETAPASSVPGTSRQTTPVVPLRPSERSADPARVSGIEEEEVQPGDARRSFGTAVLLPLREFIEVQFWAAEAFADLASLHRLAARAHGFFSPKEGQLKLLPTLFFESRHPVSFGARAVALGRAGETSIAVSSGGAHDIIAKSRVTLRLQGPVTTALTLEALYDTRNDLEFYGVGQVPYSDPRNVFRSKLHIKGLYLEERSRALASLDLSLFEGFHVVPSASLLLDRVEDAPGSGPAGLNQVFEPTRLVANAAVTRVFYSELSMLYFTRRGWAGPDPGFQIEAYGGYGTGTAGEDLRYVGAGARGSLFIPIVRASNTLSPKIALDGMVPLGGAVPFTVLVRQPEFRGFDLRRDRLSLVGSLDYRWIFVRYIAARLFVDAATVAPHVGDLFSHPPRFAAGFGFDIFGSRVDIFRFAFSASADGPRVLVNIGPTAASGDRQDRN